MNAILPPRPVRGQASDSPYWAPVLETQSREAWDAQTLALLRAHLRHAYSNSPYYRRRFDAAGLRPEDLRTLEDLRHFPTLDKAVLRERQEAVPLLGDLAAVPEEEVVYVSASSGSTGVPTVSPFTAHDFEEWIDFEARLFWASGLRPVDRYAHSLNFSLFVGGPCVLGAQKLGALSIHAGTVPSERLLTILRQFQATALWTTPSYAWYLGETAEKEGIDPRRDLAVKRIFVAGEPGGSIPETRQRIEDLWGARVYDYYGLSDVFGACAGMCEERHGLHWAEDHIHVEVLDPVTGAPVAEGERGELVLTTLRKRARPLIRFRVGDIVSFTTERCACGRTSKRLLGVHGRVDDMLIIRGVNIFPSDVEALVRKDPDFTGEYRLVVERKDHLDALTVEVEHRANSQVPLETLAERLRGHLKAVTGVGARVVVLPPDTLPRATHKAKRLDDRRGAVWTA
ncbi:phenylacetate--CoA ligase family protein [Pararhodospirillum photometricum]|uniref:Phenylacetate--CoA ligase n=1 Tax=Pararhodospirillum photometricum DSM 122 TaxID=1150469 RepID=H6SPT1_PARPM|nr:phenylacetate--CoA ligase [Pararhodospirillum photometricum]CCG07201.1 Phenylacetate--CoA ligase [Pararhodospirillum photometricum DSM 122]